MNKVLVCGGRDFRDFNKLYDTLYKINEMCPIDVIIEGDARGADRMAGCWAKENMVALKVFKADWSRHGKAAGFIRNKQMLDEGKPTMVVAFSGGVGTAMMVKLSKDRGIEVMEVS